MARRNPYPHYESCEEAWQDLLKETSRPDLSEVRRLAKYRLEHYRHLLEKDTARFAYLKSLGGRVEDHYEKIDIGVDFDEEHEDNVAELSIDERLPELRNIVDFYEELSLVSDYSDLETCKQNWINTSTNEYVLKELPPWGMILDVEEITEPFAFKHYLPKDRVKAIHEKGFFGRATAHRMTLTRQVQDFYIKDNGYIFAYAKDATEEVVQFGATLEGISERALKFWFLPDGEVQYIIPVKCIIESRLVEEKGRQHDDRWAAQVLSLPSKYALGSIIKCVRCKKRFELTQRAASWRKSSHLLCAECRI